MVVPSTPDWAHSVDDPLSLESKPGSEASLSGRAWCLRSTRLGQARPGRREDRTTDPTPCCEIGIGGVDDYV